MTPIYDWRWTFVVVVIIMSAADDIVTLNWLQRLVSISLVWIAILSESLVAIFNELTFIQC